MPSNAQKRLVWLYDKNHLRHPFLPIAVETLVDAGYSVTVVDRANKAGDTRYRHVALLDLSPVYIGNFRVRGYARIRPWILLPLMFWHTIVQRPSIIVTTLPSALVIGWLAARLLRSRLVYYPFELYGEQHSKFSPIWKKRESQVLSRGIHALITQNEQRAKIYVQERGARVVPAIVHNYKPKRSAARSGKLRDLLRLPVECRIVLFEGQLVHGRWLENLIQSVAYLPDDIRLVFMGEQKSWWRQSAESLLSAPGIEQKVLVAPWVPHAELLEYVADADVGVIIYDDQVRNNYYCEPGKLSDYVLAGVPVVVPNFPTIGPVVSRYAIGSVFDSPEPTEIAHAIISVLSAPRHVWQSALERAREDLVWETQVPHFLEAIAGQ